MTKDGKENVLSSRNMNVLVLRRVDSKDIAFALRGMVEGDHPSVR